VQIQRGKQKLTTAPEEEQKKIRASHHQEKVWMEEDHLSHAKKFGLGPDLEKLLELYTIVYNWV
jgi:hypothetical protein